MGVINDIISTPDGDVNDNTTTPTTTTDEVSTSNNNISTVRDTVSDTASTVVEKGKETVEAVTEKGKEATKSTVDKVLSFFKAPFDNPDAPFRNWIDTLSVDFLQDILVDIAIFAFSTADNITIGLLQKALPGTWEEEIKKARQENPNVDIAGLVFSVILPLPTPAKAAAAVQILKALPSLIKSVPGLGWKYVKLIGKWLKGAVTYDKGTYKTFRVKDILKGTHTAEGVMKAIAKDAGMSVRQLQQNMDWILEGSKIGKANKANSIKIVYEAASEGIGLLPKVAKVAGGTLGRALQARGIGDTGVRAMMAGYNTYRLQVSRGKTYEEAQAAAKMAIVLTIGTAGAIGGANFIFNIVKGLFGKATGKEITRAILTSARDLLIAAGLYHALYQQDEPVETKNLGGIVGMARPMPIIKRKGIMRY